MAGVTKNGAVDSSYVYDSNSSRISGTQNGVPFTATFDSQDRQITYSSGTGPVLEFEYNENGELIQYKKGSLITSFDSDSLGRLKSVTLPDSRLIEYALDWQGRRVQKTTAGSPQVRSIFEDTYRLAAEVNLQGPGIKEYVFATNVNSADYMKVGGVLYRIIKDHLGSPRLVVNASTGQVLQKMDYNEWGHVTLDTNPGFQAFGYAGGLYDPDTKLVKFGARDYDGRIGRWLSKDPIGFDGGDTNLYGYVLGDPVNFKDHDGFYNRPADDSPTEEQVAKQRMDEDSPLEDVNPEDYIAGVACFKAGKYLNSIKNSNRYLRIGKGKFPKPGSYRISIGKHQGKKIEVGVSKDGTVKVKLPK